MFPIILLLSFFQTFVLPAKNIDKIRYNIQENSKVSLDLSTNITKVNCRCMENFNFSLNQNAEYTGTLNGFQFSNTALTIDVKSINCKNKSINNDLRESLKADRFPNIEFELRSINALHQIADTELNTPKYFEVNTFLTIAGKKLPQKIKATVIRTDKLTFKFYATQAISLDDYNIVPKSPLKFVKIHDKATVTMDLSIKIKG